MHDGTWTIDSCDYADVKAMTDNRPYNEAKFNLATDGAGRQVGSSFKVYLPHTAELPEVSRPERSAA